MQQDTQSSLWGIQKYIKNINHEMSDNLSRYFTMKRLIIYPDISPWDVQQNIKNTTDARQNNKVIHCETSDKILN